MMTRGTCVRGQRRRVASEQFFLSALLALAPGLGLAAQKQAAPKGLKSSANAAIHLRTGKITADLMTVESPSSNRWSNTADGLFLVQFATQVSPDYLKQLKQLGVRVVKYIPEHTYVVRANGMLASVIDQLDTVRHVEPYQRAHKMTAATSAVTQRWSTTTSRYDITIGLESDRQALVRKLELAGVRQLRAHAGATFVEASLNAQQLAFASRLAEVLFIEATPLLEEDVDIARIQGGANYLEERVSAPGYTGVGINAHVLEGINASHPEFEANDHRQAPIAINDDNSASHGQATYGIVFGGGIENDQARGFLPNAQGFYTHYNFVYSSDPSSEEVGSRYELVGRLIRDHEVMLQTASWGFSRTLDYTARSAEMDRIIFDHDIPITQSQSNAGDQYSRPQAWAKNVISVGAVYHQGTADKEDDRWNRSASIGPAADGRIKPDICAYYDGIFTTALSGYRSDFGGTSGATPIVAGHVGLILEMYTDGIFGNEVAAGVSRFNNRPHFSTTKALLINSANQYDFEGADHDLTRVHQGWGFPDLRKLFNSRQNMLVVNEDDLIAPQETMTYQITVPEESTEELKVTLVFADPEAAVSASIHRVNNLDLRVTAPDGTMYWGNNGLLTSNYSTPGGEHNTLDTVENVYVMNPQPGTWTVEVIADEINEDGHVETEEMDADFALVASGISAR